MKKLLITAYGGGHINIQLEIADYFSKKGWDVSFLSVPNTTQVLKTIGKYKIYTFKDIASSEDLKKGEQILDKVHNFNSNIDIEESKAYAGVNYSNLISNFGERNAQQLFNSFGRRIFLPLEGVEKVLKKVNPDLVSVTLSAARAERATLIKAKQLGVKVMAIEDLFGTACAFSVFDKLYVKNQNTKSTLVNKGVSEDSVYKLKEDEESFHVASFHTGINDYIGIKYKYIPDFVFCINKKTKSHLIKRGIPSSKIFVVGHPAFDKIPREFSIKDNSKKKNTILVTTQPLDTQVQFLKLIKDAIIPLADNYKVIIRYHPSSDGVLEAKMFGDEHENITIDREKDLHEILNESPLLITQTSTTAIEAAIFNTNVLSLSLGNDNLVSFEEAGIAKELIDPNKKEVEKSINELLKLDHFLFEDSLALCDGKSSERIYKIVTK